ncbi:rhomboid family intramembrane serine protease [Candidatus Halobonum tyrrellensis]|uniref:Peptidase S54 rhomboid domain-containing protein n=1 Tax=Candidatus Halobonum tyrrellensis G22 TaxID=1324957 RepID=V4HER8_9EURY|nr:hypothetical protein K933_09062 [Candidatus Halobonum tyrrellensis G22]
MRLAVVAAFVAAGLVVAALGRTASDDRDAGVDTGGAAVVAPLRERFLFGVPWGTLTTAAFVLGVYLFVQGGYDHWYNPVVIPFRAWSYFEPLGVVTAAFAHSGPGHLLGNLMATLTLASVAEYAFGHFPDRRDGADGDGARADGGSGAGADGTSAGESWVDRPRVRAFVLFPAGAVVVGLATAAFSLGPVVGFSGVVFAFAGFSLLYRPLTTVVALTASGTLSLVYNALQNPVVVASGRAAYVTPWWASIAVQGHALGLLVGLLVAFALASRRRDALPRPGRLFVGALLFCAEQSLWAVYWYRGGETYVLYRAVGVTLVVVLALLVAALGTYGSSDASWDVFRDASLRGAVSRATPAMGAVLCLSVVTAGLAGAAVPVSLSTVDDGSLPGEPVHVRDYQVTYAEGVENGMVSVVEVSAFGETTSVNTSGVIVRNPERRIWTTAVTKGRLAFAGRSTVVLGGVGWRETVVAVREGWRTTGGNVTYVVRLRHDGEAHLSYASPSAAARPRIDGRTVAVAPTNGSFSLAVTGANETTFTPVPEGNETVSAGGLTFLREGRTVVATTGGNATRVQVAAKETYGRRRQ